MLNSQSAPRFPRSVAGERFVRGREPLVPEPSSLVQAWFGLQDKSDALRREERRPGSQGEESKSPGTSRDSRTRRYAPVRSRVRLKPSAERGHARPPTALRRGGNHSSLGKRCPEPSPANRETARGIGCVPAKLESVAGAYTWLAWSRDRGDHGGIHCLGDRCRSITVEDLLRRDGVTESAAEGAV